MGTILLYGCKSVSHVLYQEHPLVIDGNSNDWQSLQLTEKENIFYSITNDSANIYLLLEIKDNNLQKKTFMSGLSVWIDTTGRKKTNLGIICPIKNDIAAMKQGSMQQLDQMKRITKNPLIEAEFIGFEEKSLTCVASSNPYHIEISINSDENSYLHYELKVPFSSLNKKISDFKNQQISIGIEIGGVEMPPMGNKPEGMRGGQPAGQGRNMGTPPSGGMPGGMPGNSTMNELKYPTKFWIKDNILSQTK